MATVKRIEVSTENWSAVVEVRTCDRCYFMGAWWKRRLWQHPSGLLHKVRDWGQRRGQVTDCGVDLPKDMPDARLRFEGTA